MIYLKHILLLSVITASLACGLVAVASSPDGGVSTLVKPVDDDPYEDNNSMTEACADLNDGVWLSDLEGFGVSKDEDWFQVNISDPVNRRIQIECLFTHAEGDIDIVLYDASNNVLAEKISVTDNEKIETVVPSTGYYFIKIWNRDNYTDNSYDLMWKALSEDFYEPNNYLGAAYAGLPEDTLLSSIDGSGYQYDEDWYEIVVTSDQKRRVVVDCTFLQVGGDINIVLYDASGNQLCFEWTNTDNEQIDFVVPSTGAYYVKVTSSDNMGNAYDLRWNTVDYTPPELLFLSVSGADQINEYDSAQYTCTATYSDDSTSDVTDEVEWSINSQYASIDSSGLLSVYAVSSDQSINIYAVFGGKTATESVTIKDVPPTVIALSVSGTAEVDENSTASYICTATWSDASSSDVTALATWSTDSSYASISVGVLSAEAVSINESVTITAVYGGQSVNKSVTIMQVAVAEIYYMDWVVLQEVPIELSDYEDVVADDGIPNFLKYACGLPANDRCTTADLMTIVKEDSSGMFSILYNRAESAVEADVEVMWAPTPAGPWNTVLTTEHISWSGDIECRKASIQRMDRGFMRLRATEIFR